MNCKKSHCNCPKQKQQEEYRQAKRKFPLIEDPLEKWQCSDEEEKTCKYFEPYPPRMTKEQFEEEQKGLLKNIPEEFHGAFCSLAWENGHSEGYENVICHLNELIDAFEEPINTFFKNTMRKYQKKS